LRDDRSHHVFSFSDSSERILDAKKKFMRELPIKKDLDPRTAQVRDVYMACMNGPQKAIQEKEEVTRLVNEVKKISSAEQLITYSYNNVEKGLSDFVHLWPSPNLDDAKKMDATVLSSFMELPDHKYYEQADLMKAYEGVLTEFFTSIYPGIKKKDAIGKAQAVIALQKDFIKTYPVHAVQRQRWSEKRVSSQADLIKKYPNLKFDVLFGKIPTKNLLINTPIPESFDFLNAELSTRPLDVWKDMYLLAALGDLMDDGYQKFFKKNFDFEKKYFGGPTQRPDRPERCTRLVSRPFRMEIDATLVDTMFPNFDETKINEVGTRIRQSIVAGVEANKWLSKDGKKEALAKMKTARLQLVKPHNDREWDFLPLKTYDAKSFIHNLHTLAAAQWEKTLKEVSEPANQDAWGMGPLTVNAYYSPNENKFVLPIGIMQFPFYDKDGSVIENLGAVGAVMGHEMGHGIDDGGAKYDSQGRLKQWMTTKDVMEFNLRGEKMITQFNKAGHDGKLTQGENIADLVGLTFAYQAAFPKNEGSVEDKKKFFVAYARLWCTVNRPDFAQMLLKTDPHAAGWARINEQIKQQPAFAQVFQCKAGDKMTLPDQERVQIW
jgi:putative endopeptidase